MIDEEKRAEDDSILGEIRAIREAHAKRFNYDFDAMFEDLKKKEEEYKKKGYKFVSFPPKRIPKKTRTAA